ncbi:pitrilysin family protein [Anaeromyxobacter sp. Fw109-5]|uniref:M16 family metallopeptidase n=1 Tax=Anaeromyxobacter sp. (strain Fw109-5) TaxID=404589 RepID=UPI0000ED7B03|nr:pitrilysin family protein [Anaeromyxobacter sp. Fw109-5]ABS24301.1 peptidase M16 domain protein [Anaeromyxobacter sp. Fw109-5]
MKPVLPLALALAALACASSRGAAGGAEPARATRLSVPLEYHTLENGLRVVLSPERSVPKVAVGVYYGIGFRVEPKDRTGFAHLFEHMMFQGSRSLGKMEFIKLVQSNGGTLNGSTRFDFTNYFEVVPSNVLETILWAEADRMRGLAVTQENLANQQGVVANEVKVNVLNRPYGGFPWLDLPQVANENWYNAHNFYGDLADLEAATLADVRRFFETYYAPNNAVVALVGDFEPKEALAWVERHFGDIRPASQPPRPDLSEPRQEREKRAEKVDPLAERPAVALAWHAPARNTPAHAAFVLLDQMILQGRDSALYQKLVQEQGLTGEVSGGLNLLGNPWNYQGPMLHIAYLFHDKDRSAGEILRAVDEALAPYLERPVEPEALARAKVKARSALYAEMESFAGFGLADLLAAHALFDDDPARVSRIEAELEAVTPALVLETAREYLRPTNRTVLLVKTKDQGVAP